MRKNTRRTRIFKVALLSIFLAIEVIVCFVPFLGSIQIGPVVATLAMVPVIIIGCTTGPIAGGILGFFAGLFSFIWWTFVAPADPSSMLFTPWNNFTTEYINYWPLVICFVPRILTGVIAGLCVMDLKRFIKSNIVVYAISGVVGSFVNTFLVLFGTYFLWGRGYANLCGMEFATLLTVIFGIVGTNGLFEAAVSGVLGSAISKSIDAINKK